MNRRITRGLAVLGCVLAVSATTSVIVEATTNDSTSAALGASGKGLPSAEVMKYWSDTGNALAPLLLYVRLLPTAIKGLQATTDETEDGQLRQYGVMAESFATARDLVGRIAVPAGAPAGVSELLQVACQLYRQSALALTELKIAQTDPARPAVLRRAASLQAVGDRLFDQARRVLDIDAVGEGQAPVEYRYAPPVPAVADLTGQPASSRAAGQNLDQDLRSAALLISEASTGKSSAPAATFQALRGIASGLEVNPAGQGEDVIGARLAIALALLAEGAKVDGQPKSADSLLMLSNDLWNQARTLNPQPHPALQQLDAPKLARAQVWTGGEFNGSPPALLPGQDVGSGVPGGLPKINPTEILKG
jgi:hypothetical protein